MIKPNVWRVVVKKPTVQAGFFGGWVPMPAILKNERPALRAECSVEREELEMEKGIRFEAKQQVTMHTH